MENRLSMRLVLPRLYVILDSALLTISVEDCAQEFADAGVRLLQYRAKDVPALNMLNVSRTLASLLVPRGVSFIVNDRPDIAILAEATGVHVGQEDLGVESARELVGKEKLVGVSTHNLEQFQAAAETSADYIAVGPVFATSSKVNPDPVVGTEFVRRVRDLCEKPIVAIGGITLENAASVIKAGADCVAVISDILRAPDRGRRAKQYLEILGSENRSVTA
jgi:thiamine-phosphate pyrophosphorylase